MIQYLCLTLWKRKCIVWFSDSVFILVVLVPVVFSQLVVFLFIFFSPIWLYWVISFPIAYGGLLLLLLRQPLWPFDCMETRFCTSVTDAANESMREERAGLVGEGGGWRCRVSLQKWKKRSELEKAVNLFLFILKINFHWTLLSTVNSWQNAVGSQEFIWASRDAAK